MHRKVAEKIRQNPGLMDFVRSNLDSTLNDTNLSDSCKDSLREWQHLIETLPLDRLLQLVTEDSEEGQRLRHSTPFWGILTPKERNAFFHQHEPAAA